MRKRNKMQKRKTTFVSYRFLHAASITTSLTFKTKKIFSFPFIVENSTGVYWRSPSSHRTNCVRVFVCVCEYALSSHPISMRKYFADSLQIYRVFLGFLSFYFINSCVSIQNGFMFWGFFRVYRGVCMYACV